MSILASIRDRACVDIGLGVNQELARRDDVIARRQPFVNRDAIARLDSELDRLRPETALAKSQHNPIRR